jgi:glycosyltransferase involved in cell wall biosynthesis
MAFAIPGDLMTPTGGYIYDREVLARLPKFGVSASHLALPGGYPDPSPRDLDETARLFARVPEATVLLIDGLAFGAMPPELVSTIRQRIVAMVHHPLGYEAGLSPAAARRLLAMERLSLARTMAVVVPSPSIAQLLTAEFSVPTEKITVAQPGTASASRAKGTGNPSMLLAVGAVSARKGYDILVEALAPLKDLTWRLTIAGPTDRQPAALEALLGVMASTGLSDRVTLAGALSQAELGRLYAEADVFALPSLFEGYGMALAEAMARGLPIVCTTGGAAAETVPDDAAIKVPPGAVEPLRGALRRVISDSALRRRLGEASWRAGQRLPGWDDTARLIAGVIKDVAA